MKRRGSGRIDLRYGEAEALVVFHHIRKTAGTSLRALITSQYPEAQSVRAPVIDQGHPPPPGLSAWYERLWQKRGRDPRLACLSGHSVNYLLGIIDRPVVAITLLRDPVKRVLSRYQFSNRLASGKGQGFGALIRSMPLRAIYERYGRGSTPDSPEHRLLAQMFNGQARSLLDPLYDTAELSFTEGPPADADLWRARAREALGSTHTWARASASRSSPARLAPHSVGRSARCRGQR